MRLLVAGPIAAKGGYDYLVDRVEDQRDGHNLIAESERRAHRAWGKTTTSAIARQSGMQSPEMDAGNLGILTTSAPFFSSR
jgi:hypothetical protein